MQITLNEKLHATYAQYFYQISDFHCCYN